MSKTQKIGLSPGAEPVRESTGEDPEVNIYNVPPRDDGTEDVCAKQGHVWDVDPDRDGWALCTRDGCPAKMPVARAWQRMQNDARPCTGKLCGCMFSGHRWDLTGNPKMSDQVSCLRDNCKATCAASVALLAASSKDTLDQAEEG